MATNISLTTQPDLWSSAYSDIEYVFDFTEYTISSTASVGGYAKITIVETWDILPPVNSFCYIDSGEYLGLHKVTASTTNTITLNATYVSNQTTGNIKSLRTPVFSLYKGFDADEQFPSELPYELVGNFTLLFNSENQLVVNIKGLIQRIFDINAPDLNADYDFSSFNAYRLSYDGVVTEIRYALNSSITTTELNESYLTNGNFLVNTDKPLLFGCGVTFATKFVDGFPKLLIYNGGTQVVAGFDSAFQTNQFSQGFDIN